MRNFMKVSAITAGIMIFLGIGLFTVGGCGGGFSETVQKIVNGDFNFTDEDLKNIIGNYVSSNDSLEITVNEENKYLPVLVNSVSGTDLNQSFIYALQQALNREGLQNLAPADYYSEAVKVIEKWKREYPDAH